MTFDDVFTSQGGAQYNVHGESVLPVHGAGFRMEFHLSSETKQAMLVVNLSHQAYCFLRNLDPELDPHEWLWKEGYQMLKNAVEMDEFEEREYHILQRHVTDLPSIRLKNLPRQP